MGTSFSKASCAACGQPRDNAEGVADCPPTVVASDCDPAAVELLQALKKEASEKELDAERGNISEVSTTASTEHDAPCSKEAASIGPIKDVSPNGEDSPLLDAGSFKEAAKTESAKDEPLHEMFEMPPSPDDPDASVQDAPLSSEAAAKAAAAKEVKAAIQQAKKEAEKAAKEKKAKEEEKAKKKAAKAAEKAAKKAAEEKAALYKKKSYLQRYKDQKAEYEANKEANMKKVEDIMAGKYRKEGGGNPGAAQRINMPTPADRTNTRKMMLGNFRAQYAKIGRQPGKECPSALSQEALSYSAAETEALTIVGGHQNIPRPPGVVVPKDFRKPWPGGKPKEKNPEDRLATMTLKQLAEFGADSERKLCSVYGDIFDVSDRPDKYGPTGPYHWMSGADITWGFVSGKDVPETVNKCYDLWKVAPDSFRESKLRTIYAWVGFYEWEYGLPIAKLDLYAQEAGLKGPPMEESEDCCIM